MQLKERTFQQIEEVNKNFTAIHDTLIIRDKSQGTPDSEVTRTEKQACVKVNIFFKKNTHLWTSTQSPNIVCKESPLLLQS